MATFIQKLCDLHLLRDASVEATRTWGRAVDDQMVTADLCSACYVEVEADEETQRKVLDYVLQQVAPYRPDQREWKPLWYGR